MEHRSRGITHKREMASVWMPKEEARGTGRKVDDEPF